MFCSGCGLEIGQVNFCSNCGTKAGSVAPSANSNDVETLHLKPGAKFSKFTQYPFKVVGGDFKLGDWILYKGSMAAAFSFKNHDFNSKNVDRIEVIKDGLSIDEGNAKGAGFVAGAALGGFAGAIIGQSLGGALKSGGSIIKIVFKDGKSIVALVNGDLMAVIYGASI